MSIIDKIRSKFSGPKKAVPSGIKNEEKIPVWEFKQIGIDDTSRSLRIDERARDDANQGLPALDSHSWSFVEQEIIGHIEGVRDRAQATYSGKRENYANSLNLLNFEEELGKMKRVNDPDQGEKIFNDLFHTAELELDGEKKKLNNKQKDLENFRKENNLDREPHPRTTPQQVLILGIIFVLWFIETVGNASFLAKGNELGFYGAYIEATVISILNLGFAFMLGRLVTNLVHVNRGKKFIGAVCAVAFVVFAVGFNLMVAHYRESTGTVLDEGGLRAVANFLENPFGLKEFQSWILFGMGCLFAIISFIDGIMWDDLYPGYGKHARSVIKAEEEYKEIYREHQEKLHNKFQQEVKKLEDIKQRIMRNERRFKEIENDYENFIESFRRHIDHIESLGNGLLRRYQATNIRWREGNQEPERFGKKWRMTKPRITADLPVMPAATVETYMEETEENYQRGLKSLRQYYDASSGDIKRDFFPTKTNQNADYNEF